MAGVQDGLTVIAPVLPAQLAALQQCLDAIDQQVQNGLVHRAPGVLLPFGELPNVHFARLAVVDFSVDVGAHSDPRLVFCTDFDGDLDRHLDELVAILTDGLAEVFGHCVGYSATAAESRADRLRTFLRARRVANTVFYSGAPGRTVGQIRAEARLYACIQEFLNRPAARGGSAVQDIAQMRAAIQAHVRRHRNADGTAEFWWAEMPDDSELHTRRNHFLSYLADVAVFPLLPILLVFAFFQVLTEILRRQASNPPVTGAEKSLVQRDNESGPPGGQNRMTAITVTRPRRLWLQKLGLRVIKFRVTYTYYEGSLAGIVTIHFARWVLVDRCLLFCSTYDNSWENYLGEFIDRAWYGLNLLWGHAIGYPRTRAWVFGGARDEQRFKAFVQRRQYPTQVWYSAYPDIPIASVKRNFHLRNGLFAALSDSELRQWASLL
jgi:hypothetical protein